MAIAMVYKELLFLHKFPLLCCLIFQSVSLVFFPASLHNEYTLCIHANSITVYRQHKHTSDSESVLALKKRYCIDQ